MSLSDSESTEATSLLFELVEHYGGEPCRLDHNDFCQAHYFDSPCAVDRARRFLGE